MPSTIPFRAPIPNAPFAVGFTIIGDPEHREIFVKGLPYKLHIAFIENVARRADCYIRSRSEGDVLFVEVDPRHRDLVSREDFDECVQQSLNQIGFLVS